MQRQWIRTGAWLVFILAVVIVLTLARCSRSTVDDSLLAAMDAARSQAHSVRAMVRVSDGLAMGMTRLALRASAQFDDSTPARMALHLEVVEADAPGLSGTLVVCDGATVWIYYPSQRLVVTGSANASPLVRAAGRMAADPDLGLVQALFTQSLRGLRVEPVAQEMFDGRPTWHVRVTPAGASPPPAFAGLTAADLWVDQKHFFPVRARLDLGGIPDVDVQVTDLEINPSFPPDLFHFAPPSTARVLRVAMPQE